MKTVLILLWSFIGLLITLVLPYPGDTQSVLINAVKMAFWIAEKGYPEWAHLMNVHAWTTLGIIAACGRMPVIFPKLRLTSSFPKPHYY